MTEAPDAKSRAQEAAEEAQSEVFQCIRTSRSFVLEAGAGSGKTHALVETLRYLIEQYHGEMSRRHQKVACITFTNVAKAEIEQRYGDGAVVHCDTIHSFCWSLVCSFQKRLRMLIPEMKHWPELLHDVEDIHKRRIEYNLGHRRINADEISIHHDDVILLAIELMKNAKFRRLLTSKYPYILIDEYQDTKASWMAAIQEHFIGRHDSPVFGLFGDHWQKIYGDGCGEVDHPALTVIGKKANFRSAAILVDCLNRMRPELPQHVHSPDQEGSVLVFHTNSWNGTRRQGAHWAGDLPAEKAHEALRGVIELLDSHQWDLSPTRTKILMLTHRGLAAEMGYGSLPEVFAHSESFTKKENELIAFLVDRLEPACVAFARKKYGDMFSALDTTAPVIRSCGDKEKWQRSMSRLLELREHGTVADVLEHLRKSEMPRLPDSVARMQRELSQVEGHCTVEVPRHLQELSDLHRVPYSEIVALANYLSGHSPFETKHGVKGAEFENVIVVVGRGWSQYNFSEMLELAGSQGPIPASRRGVFERSRNLFYVTCSRPRKRLAILFTQELSSRALLTVQTWFGANAVMSLLL